MVGLLLTPQVLVVLEVVLGMVMAAMAMAMAMAMVMIVVFVVATVVVVVLLSYRPPPLPLSGCMLPLPVLSSLLPSMHSFKVTP